GWVRCGRCSQVFNALESLFDLDRDTAPGSLPSELNETAPSVERTPAAPASPAAWSTDFASAARTPAASHGAEPAAQRDKFSLVDQLDSELFLQRHAATSSRFTPMETSGFGALRHDSELSADDGVPSRPFESNLPFEDSAPMQHDTSGAPEFLRHADRLARWDRPWVRTSLSLASLALLATLLIQSTHHWRHTIAARWPDALPLLAQWCEFASCAIEPPRRIDDIGLESSGFARLAGVDQFRVSVVLRNRSATVLAMPWVELSLTDASGNLLVRKALSPQDFRVASAVLAAQSEANLQLVLATGTPLVTGYTVEIFYP
ncbi:MAG: DUF3426 domain-containing protein, partial [Burkholderiaceae bacterium]